MADFELYSAYMGIQRVHYQQIMHAGYDLWLPVSSDGVPAQTFGPFYGRQLVGDFLGNTGGNTQVAALNVSYNGMSKRKAGGTNSSTTNEEPLVAYGAFVHSKLVRIALINFEYWDAASSVNNPSHPNTTCAACPVSPMERPITNVFLHGLESVQKVTVKLLDSLLGATSLGPNITYGGMQWTKESDGLPVQVSHDTIKLAVTGGKAEIQVQASSAVVIHLKY